MASGDLEVNSERTAKVNNHGGVWAGNGTLGAFKYQLHQLTSDDFLRDRSWKGVSFADNGNNQVWS